MTNDELAEAFRGLIREAHAKINALPDGGVRTGADRRLRMLHADAEGLRDFLVARGEIQPLSGGDDDKDAGPP